jgi:hypothetical protein
LILGLALAFSIPTVTACTPPPTLTPAQVQALGKREFPGHDRAAVVKASDTALRTLGYEVVVADPKTGQVKTAPKPLVVTAAGSATTAIAVSNDLAWSLEITSVANGASMQATPRASSGGQSYDGPMDQAYMEKAFADLFKEIESNL